MKNLSITQEFLLCSLNDKGKLPSFTSEKLVCLLASGLLELQLENCIDIEGNKVIVKSELPTDLDYLGPLFNYIKQANPVKISKIVGAYNFSITDKHLNQLVNSVGDSLARANTANIEYVKSGLAYVPNKSSVNKIIDKIRAEIFEDELITEDVTILVILLYKSGLIKNYFSKYENSGIKEKT